MNNATRLAIFQAQVKNVKSLNTARRQVLRAINDALRTDNQAMAGVQTKLYAQLFCAWAEANFLKVLHTPFGFTLDEIAQIKKEWSSNGITEGWAKCVELGLRKVPANRSGFVPNARKRLLEIVKAYVSEPSLIRNKVAHGQWAVALNRGNTAVNPDLTQQLQDLSVVTVDIWFKSHTMLALIIESLIESPKKTFVRDYWPQLAALESFIEESKGWSLAQKTTLLKAKASSATRGEHR